jgi:hypothetical protein
MRPRSTVMPMASMPQPGDRYAQTFTVEPGLLSLRSRSTRVAARTAAALLSSRRPFKMLLRITPAIPAKAVSPTSPCGCVMDRGLDHGGSMSESRVATGLLTSLAQPGPTRPNEARGAGARFPSRPGELVHPTTGSWEIRPTGALALESPVPQLTKDFARVTTARRIRDKSLDTAVGAIGATHARS